MQSDFLHFGVLNQFKIFKDIMPFNLIRGKKIFEKSHSNKFGDFLVTKFNILNAEFAQTRDSAADLP